MAQHRRKPEPLTAQQQLESAQQQPGHAGQRGKADCQSTHEQAARAERCLSIAACADIRVDPIGECGNNVVEHEIGEDCDLIVDADLGEGLVCGPPDGSPTACRYLCAGDAICPSGWACFDDGICRYPTMLFEEEEEPRLIVRADQIEVAPFSGEDHDEIAARLGVPLPPPDPAG